MSASYQSILGKQLTYSVELANNQDFKDFTVSDWEQSFDYTSAPEGSKPATPAWSEALSDKFSSDISTESQLESAIDTLIYWRNQYGLEAIVMFRRRLSIMWIPEDTFNMCSDSTEDLGLIYRDAVLDNCCDSRPMNYYPLLDRIDDWMDQ